MRPFLTAEWRHLAMLNFAADPALLAPFVPSGTELDFWNSRTFVSLVGFLFLKTRLLGVPIPFHRNFEEVNLRFYVRRKADDGWRRGVVFIREFVPRRAVALIANGLYNENYAVRRMTSEIRLPCDSKSTPGSVNYTWSRRGERHSMRLEFVGDPEPAAAGSEEEFITEHYWGYTRQRDGGTAEYLVEHPKWRVWRATAFHLHCDADCCYGWPFGEVLKSPPSSAFVADGSPVAVYRGRCL